MSSQFVLVLTLAIMVIALAALACAQAMADRHRYRAVTDPASSTRRQYVIDSQTKKFLQRQVQVRVSNERALPEPLISPKHGNQLSTTLFESGACGSGNMDPSKFILRDGYRLWQFTDIFGPDDLRGNKSFGITVNWFDSAGEKHAEPLEVFSYPPVTAQSPNEWTPWLTASHQQQGQFGWWDEVHGTPKQEPVAIKHPFELRWRLILTDEPQLQHNELPVE